MKSLVSDEETKTERVAVASFPANVFLVVARWQENLPRWLTNQSKPGLESPISLYIMFLVLF